MKQVILIFLSAIAGVVLAFILNFIVIEKILIPDPCYYHVHGTNKVFDIFYYFPSFEGGHPFPTQFNFIFTIIIGALLGIVFCIYKLKFLTKK